MPAPAEAFLDVFDFADGKAHAVGEEPGWHGAILEMSEQVGCRAVGFQVALKGSGESGAVLLRFGFGQGDAGVRGWIGDEIYWTNVIVVADPDGGQVGFAGNEPILFQMMK